MNRLNILPGSDKELGAIIANNGVNFAIAAPNAEKVELCLFDQANDAFETHRLTLPVKSADGIWHGFVPGLKEGQLYGYRVYGPYEPHNGHRFNHHKLLIDPYAKELKGELRTHKESLYGYYWNNPDSFNTIDSAPDVAKGVVIKPPAKKSASAKPNIPLKDTIVYETHLKGMTAQNLTIPKALRGTAQGMTDKNIITHIKDLGVTTIELLPVHAYFNDKRLHDMGLRNYWGYNNVSFFAPDPHLLSSGKAHEVRDMVDTMHKNGLEVMLDVVFNHTAEGSHLGPTFSWRGIDNAAYYHLEHDKRLYTDHTGTGNTLRTDHPLVRRQIMDSLRYWTEQMGVDGFRFDLGTVLMREGPQGRHVNPHSALLTAIADDPVLKTVKLTGEPWDIHTYQLGKGHPRISDWNDKFRDHVRSFWNEKANMSSFASALTGSHHYFKHNTPQPQRSVNFITAHDGQTLEDNVSYQGKYNLANGEHNRDGHGHNIANNYGMEGKTNDPTILKNRLHVKQGMMASLMLAQGLPMMLAGDEFGNSQNGNNNAYCQDNPTGWLDWQNMKTPQGKAMYEWTKKLIAIKKQYPILRAGHYLHGHQKDRRGVPDISWFNEHGTTPTAHDWHKGSPVAMVLNNAALPANENPQGEQSRLYIVFNATAHNRHMTLPQLAGSKNNWTPVLTNDTAANSAGYAPGASYNIPARSVAIFAQKL